MQSSGSPPAADAAIARRRALVVLKPRFGIVIPKLAKYLIGVSTDIFKLLNNSVGMV